MRRFIYVLTLTILFIASAAAMASSLPNPPDTVQQDECLGMAQIMAEPISLNKTALVRVDASCMVYPHPELWKVEWLRYEGGALIQDVFQEPVTGADKLNDTYLYPNDAAADTEVEVRFWSEENECICAGNISLSAPVTPTPIPTTGSQYEYIYFSFGEHLDENGTLNRQIELRHDAGLYNFLIITLYNQSMVTGVRGAPKNTIAYQTISVTGEVPGTENALYEMVPPGLVLVSNGAWEIGPASWWFVPYGGLTIAYNELRIPPGNAEAGMRMYRLDPLGGGWLLVTGTSVNTDFNTVSTDVSEMGIYALFAVDTITLNTITINTTESTTAPTETTDTTTTVQTTAMTSTTETAGYAAVTAVNTFIAIYMVVMLRTRGKRRVN